MVSAFVGLPGDGGCFDLAAGETRGGEGEDEDEEAELGEDADESEMVDEFEHDELDSGGDGVVRERTTLLSDLTIGLLVTGCGAGTFIESQRSSSCFRLSLALNLSMRTSFFNAFS